MFPSLKFSIVTPSYNQAPFLEQAIRSVQEQDYSCFEHFVFDGGSTDGSVDIIRKYADRLTCWVSEKDGGQSDSINKGWARSTGDILAWLNSDDIYLPGALRAVAKTFATNPQAVAVVGDCLRVDKSGNKIGREVIGRMDLYSLLTCDQTIAQPAVFVRRQVYETIGGLNSNLYYALDWDYWIRLALHFSPGRVCRLPVTLAAARRWGGAKTVTGVERICEEKRSILTSLFDRGLLPPEVQQRRAIAFSLTYWWQAFLERKAGRSWDARRHAWQAWRMAPEEFSIWRLLRFWIKTFTPSPVVTLRHRIADYVRGD